MAHLHEFFRVLPPHHADEKAAHGQAWAAAHESKIREELRRFGPPERYSRTDVILGSKIFTEPNSIDTTAEMFFRSFGFEPNDLKGKRLLDIGAFAGGMSFFAEDCGATVVAVDIQDPRTNGFEVLHRIRRSTVTHVLASIYDIHPDLFGLFDIVVFSVGGLVP